MKCSPATFFNEGSSQIAIWESLAAVEVDESVETDVTDQAFGVFALSAFLPLLFNSSN